MRWPSARARTFCIWLDVVYDAHKIPLDEDSTASQPICMRSHLAREMMLASILNVGRSYLCGAVDQDLDRAIPTPYGPTRFVRSALHDGASRYTVTVRNVKYVFIDDAVQLLWLMLQHSSQALNVATRKAVSFGHVANLVVELSGRPAQIEYVERTVAPIHKPYKPTQVFRFLYNLGRPVGPVVHRTFLNSAVFSAFPGFRFTPLREAIRSFIDTERREPEDLFLTDDGAEAKDRVCRSPRPRFTAISVVSWLADLADGYGHGRRARRPLRRRSSKPRQRTVISLAATAYEQRSSPTRPPLGRSCAAGTEKIGSLAATPTNGGTASS
jgi:hypothetical protein